MTSILRDKDQLINQVVSLDFFQLRQNLVDFLKNQSQFTDQNFEGSNYSVLLDNLTFNTFYNAFYLNALASEMFLSTSTQRAATVARAQGLGYIPRSVRGAQASLTLNLTYDGIQPVLPSSIPIPIGTTFQSKAGGGRYNFVTTTEHSASINLNGPLQPPAANGDVIYTAEITVTEGILVEQEIVVDVDNINLPIILDNANIDTTTIKVNVAFGGGSIETEYNQSTDAILLTPTSNVFFLQEIDNLQYQITFGDGVLGLPLHVGDVVSISYLVSSADAVNGASQMTLSSIIPDAVLSSNPSFPGIVVDSPADGGASIEDISSIKINAPLQYQTQNRAVTDIDFAQIIKSNFSYVQSLSVWGGETNVPVALGYVFISILPTSGANLLSTQQKNEIEHLLSTKYSVLCIQPVIVDPDFTFVRIDSTIKYSPYNTAVDSAALQAAVENAIIGFNSTFLSFGNYFRYSKLVAAIDAASDLISNSLTTVYIEKRPMFSNQNSTSYIFNLYNPIIPTTLNSDTFEYTSGSVTSQAAFFKDDGQGNIGVWYYNNVQVLTQIGSNVGTIDYNTGVILISNFKIEQGNTTSYFQQIRLSAEPLQNDIVVARNGILIIDNDSVNVSTFADTRA